MRESEHPDFCHDCEEIHSARCPQSFCEGCGWFTCICDDYCED